MGFPTTNRNTTARVGTASILASTVTDSARRDEQAMIEREIKEGIIDIFHKCPFIIHEHMLGINRGLAKHILTRCGIKEADQETWWYGGNMEQVRNMHKARRNNIQESIKAHIKSKSAGPRAVTICHRLICL